MDLQKCNVDNGDVFDVWVDRRHFSDMSPLHGIRDDYIRICSVVGVSIEKVSGCCMFTFSGACRDTISRATCKHLFEFLPRPGELWNVWSNGDGVMHVTEHPLWLDGKVGKRYPKTEHKSEKKWYDPKSSR